ncbi:glycosyl transferase [Halopseudomonas salina]|uniref:Glycosyl transferase n=2 Tax=Halopseudomonas salina TaxID=1323744 RepID=A0ABQ1PVK7_9GAMM|nr:glycosyl transferase [Halopseudomonas salina]
MKLSEEVVKLKISVVIPAKNEAATIGTVVETVRALALDLEVIVVDDGSDDDTGIISSVAGAIVIKHPYSKGNGAAIKTGARHAKGDVLVFMDGDGQHDADSIVKLVDRLLSGHDLVVGSRQRGSQANVWRGTANRFYNWLATYMSGHKVSDLTSGFRAVRAEKFREFIYLLPNGFSYPTTSTMAFFRAGYSVAYEPIHVAKRVGTSHIRPLKDGTRFVLIIFKIGTLYSPLKIFAPISLLIFMLGMGWYGYTLSAFDKFTNMSALLFTSSAMIFLMGLISEQITMLMYKRSE